jgi:3-oxoacyl-[acyl-carrier protein] reductase
MKQRVAIVTGAAHPLGMGFAACRKLAETGALVVVTDLVESDDAANDLQRRADEIVVAGGEAIAIGLDVTSREQVDACVSKVINVLGSIDCLFNNAGSPAGVGDFLTMTDRQWDVSYAVNLKGTANMCRAVLPHMIEQGRGAIVNNASVAGLGAVGGMAAYTATKFAVVGLTKALAAEFGAQNIRVNAVCPGMVWTQMGQQEVNLLREDGESDSDARARLAGPDVVPLSRWAKADEIADAVVYLTSDAASYITGVALPVAGGMAPGL